MCSDSGVSISARKTAEAVVNMGKEGCFCVAILVAPVGYLATQKTFWLFFFLRHEKAFVSWIGFVRESIRSLSSLNLFCTQLKLGFNSNLSLYPFLLFLSTDFLSV